MVESGAPAAARPAVAVRPIVRPLPAAWTTDHVAAALERLPHAVFFESAGPDLESGAWTLLAFDPLWQVEVREGRLRRVLGVGAGEAGPRESRGAGTSGRGDSVRSLPPPRDRGDLGPALEALERIWPARAAYDPAPPLPFASGLAGTLAYDLKDLFERYPSRARREWPHPDLLLGYYDVVFGWNRETGEAWAVATGFDGRAVDASRAEVRLDAAWTRLERAIAGSPDGAAVARILPDEPSWGALTPIAVSDFSRDGYLRVVERALEHIAAGDIYQVNLSQRFWVEPAPPPAALYRRLRAVAPAPFLAYAALPDGSAVASSSPERFFSIRGSRIESWPIKGTRPRGRSPEEDLAMAEALRASEKDRAENLMIVDLERNDLGRVCRVGSIRVPALWEVATHSNVHHLVSRVVGELRDDAGPMEILGALFPGGSITGAPKIRSVEIIDALEPVRRGVYTGAVGYWDASGDADWNIAIRTVTVGRGAASFHAGGGIVADSTPEGEYEETLIKASGMMRALGVKRAG
ncbi:MAG TPA: aminodeoxychorismate synthase component I [Acidobacteriota bacterium]|nr:aminodeoxychorismate synthase component I [Acidobacteriota bacterium]